MKSTKEFLSNLKHDTKVAFYIGPEGGFEEYEIQKAMEYGTNLFLLEREF